MSDQAIPMGANWYQRITRNQDAFGFALLIGSQFFNAIMITTCKLLVADDEFEVPIHPIQILFVRMFITYICCVLYMTITRLVPNAPFGEPQIRKWLVLRGIVGFVGVFGLYFSLLYLSVSDAVAITFLVPLVTAFLAWILLHERYSLIEGLCSLVSLVGVVLIAKPNFIFGSAGDNELKENESVESSSTEKRLLATAVGLFGVLGASSVYIVLRKIGNAAHPLLSVSYFALSTVIVSTICIIAIPSISFAIPQNAYQWSLFFAIGIAGFLFQFALTAGVQRVKASKASLVVYTQMIFAIVLDLIIWHHFPGFLSILGILIIIGCTLLVIKYKPQEQEQDLESGKHHALPQQDGDLYNPEEIQLQQFVIDDEDNESNSEFNELNSMKDSPSVKLNL